MTTSMTATQGGRSADRPPGRARRAVGRFCNGLLMVVAAVFLATVLGSVTGLLRLVPVRSGSMEPSLPTGSLAVAIPIGSADVGEGDVIVFRAPDDAHVLMIHRVLRIEPDGTRAMRTQGDANPGPDPWHLRLVDDTTHRVVGHVPWIGTVLSRISSATVGLALAIPLVLFLSGWALVRIWAPAGPRRRELGRTTLGPPLLVLCLVGGSRMAEGALASFTATPPPPAAGYASATIAAPTAVGCRWADATSVRLDWIPSPTAQGYRLERAAAPGGTFATVATLTGGAASTATDFPPAPVTTARAYRVTSAAGNWWTVGTAELDTRACRGAIGAMAGTGLAGSTGDGAAATAARLRQPRGLASDSSGTTYIADTANNRVRMVDASGVITTVAGTGVAGFSGDSGPAVSATLSAPSDVAVDTLGRLFIADTSNRRIRCVGCAGTATITTVAGNGTSGFSGDGGPASGARLNGPRGVAVDGGNDVIIADTGNNRVRRFTVGGSIQTIAGGGASTGCATSGAALSVSLSAPGDVEASGTDVIVADTGRNCVRRVAGGQYTHVAGGGSNTACSFSGAPASVSLSSPRGVAVGIDGRVLVADSSRRCIRVADATTVQQVALTGASGTTGDDGPAVAALMGAPWDAAVLPAGDVVVSDQAATSAVGASNRVRRIVAPLG